MREVPPPEDALPSAHNPETRRDDERGRRRRHGPLRRSRRHRLVAGVCGGLARWLGWNPTLVRVLFVLVGALPFLSGILVYALLWLLVPLEDPAA